MNTLLPKLKKYLILLICSSFIHYTWSFIKLLINKEFYQENLEVISTIIIIVDALVSVIIAILLFKDLKFESVKFRIFVCIVTLLDPLLGTLIFSLLYILYEKNKIVVKV